MGAASLVGLFFGVLVRWDGRVSRCCHGGIFEDGVKRVKIGARNWRVKVASRFMMDALVP
jgi:hypothetical protein